MSRTTLVSVDLDGVGCYHAIHGLPEPGETSRDVVLDKCLPRFIELFDQLGVEATFFVIGHEVRSNIDDGGTAANVLASALQRGHELGNHGFAHAYDMVTWPAADIRRDLEACDALLCALGADVRGFRAPGYTHDAKMLQVVAELGYDYDTSALPSPPYYAAKLAAMGAMRLLGRRSQSMAKGAGSFLGGRLPHRRRDAPLWELPMSVTPVARLPLIGTSILSTPWWLSTPLSKVAEALPYFHLELHGLDLADPDEDDYGSDLLHRQPELRVPLGMKLDRLTNLLRARGRTQTLASYAATLG